MAAKPPASKPLPSDFLETARQRFADRLDTWYSSARDDYDFMAGRQWAIDDEAELISEDRPALTFNYSEKMVDAVIGAEVNNRQEVVFRPRGMEDAGGAEAYTEAARWARELSNAEHEESDALRDMLTCGVGWVETRVDHTIDPDGRIVIERIDPLEMDWDRAATRPGLVDRRWQCRTWWADLSAAQRAWPKFDFTQTGTGRDDAYRNAGVTLHREGRAYSRGDKAAVDEDIDRSDQVLIRHYQTYSIEPYYRVAAGEQLIELDEPAFKRVRKQLDAEGIQYARQNKRVYYRAFFCGDALLDGGPSPCQDGFTFTPITGKRDRNSISWYGLTRVMKDPQRWANKWLSQAVYILNANAKGGLLAETDAFVDPRKAEAEWARPDSITLLQSGGLEKVKEKVPAPYPAGFDRLMSFALESLPMVTGINLEALGLANREQAGVLESQRKQAAYGILAPYFDSMRLYRREQGRTLLYYLRHYIADGRWIRLLGDAAKPAIQLNKLPDNIAFDIIVDQAPTAPDVKQRTWESLIQLVPALLKAGVPIPPDILDYTPLPVQLAQSWKQYVQQAQGQASPEQQQKMQEEQQKLTEENHQLKMQLRDKSQELQLKAAETEAELSLKEKELQAKLAMQQAEMTGQLQLKQRELEMQTALSSFEAETTAGLEREKTTKQLSLQEDKVKGERKIKAMSAGLSSSGSDEDVGLVSDTVQKIADSQQQVEQALTTQSDALEQLNATLEKLLGVATAPKTATMPDGRRITIAPNTGPQPLQ
jgi:hypothetical protein